MDYLIILASLLFSSGMFIISFKKFIIEKSDLEEKNKRLSALRKVDEIMMSSEMEVSEVCQRIVDAVATELGFEIGVLALANYQKGVLRRIAMSRTPSGNKAKQLLPFRYEDWDVSLNTDNNISIAALRSGETKVTDNLYDIFSPTLGKDISDQIQKIIGIKSSFVYPITAKQKIIGIMIFSSSKESGNVSGYDRETMQALVDVVGIAVDNALLYQRVKEKTDELTRVNQEIAKMNDHLNELDALKNDFVSIASHELRTPMTAIRSYAWMALNRPDIPLSDKVKRYLSRTLISTERLINLVNDMLNISRIESGKIDIIPRSFDIRTLVNDVLVEVEAKAGEKKLRLSILGGLVPRIFADPDKVHEVLLNLIGNAMKFTSNGGSISISFFSDGKVIETAVKDSGVGITPQDLSRLFTRFGRLDNSYVAAATSGGTGLGLYICKGLIEAMKGQIWADSEGSGKGTTVTFSLPAATEEVLTHPDQFTRKAHGDAKLLEPVAI